jgi:hypothetical protein
MRISSTDVFIVFVVKLVLALLNHTHSAVGPLGTYSCLGLAVFIGLIRLIVLDIGRSGLSPSSARSHLFPSLPRLLLEESLLVPLFDLVGVKDLFVEMGNLILQLFRERLDLALLASFQLNIMPVTFRMRFLNDWKTSWFSRVFLNC